MIIVDALCYAMSKQATGATLCFITNDQDFAYLLSRIARMPKFRTVLIMSNPIANSMLARSADHVLSWSVDLFKLEPTASVVNPIELPSPVHESVHRSTSPEVDDVDPDASSEEADSEQLLISVMTRLSQAGYDTPARSLVASGLKNINPVRFDSPASRRSAIESGLKSGIVASFGIQGGGNFRLVRK